MYWTRLLTTQVRTISDICENLVQQIHYSKLEVLVNLDTDVLDKIVNYPAKWQ